jgi:hypothetical protein
MSQEALNLLAANEDIVSLKTIYNEDPTIKQIKEQLPVIEQGVVNLLAGLSLPTLDLNEFSIKEGNAWLGQIQQKRDDCARYDSILKTYEYHIKRHWTLAYSICMTQPVIESMRSNEQRVAHIDRLFPEIVDLRERATLAAKKLQIVHDNLQQASYNFSAQQKNIQFLAGLRHINA